MKWYFKCLKQYADFSGRARRKEYWWFGVINFIIMTVLMIGFCIPIFKMGYNAAAFGADDIVEEELMLTVLKSPFLYIYLIYYLAILIPSISVTVRRLHDIGKSGYWAFLIFGGSMLAYIGEYFQTTSTLVYVILGLISFVIIIVSLVCGCSPTPTTAPTNTARTPKAKATPPRK